MVKLSKYEKIATAIVWLVYFVYGIATSLMNTTIIDLTEILQTDVSNVSYGLLSRAVFHCIGAPLFGWTFTLFSREFQYALSLALFGLGTCFTASSKTFTTFIVFNSLAGLATSGIDIASYVILLEIYKDNANPYLQAMGGFWGLGQILAPLITRPFLSSEETFETGNTTITKHIPTSIQIPYNVLGIACVVVGGFVMIFTCFYESQKSKSSDHSPKTKVEPDLASRSSSLSASFRENIGKHPIKREDSFLLPKKLPKGYYITIVLLAAILVNFQIGLDLDFFNFLHTYAVEGPTKITKSDASYLVSLCGFVQLASRFVSIFISIYIRPGTIISVSSLITLAAVISLIFTGTTITGLWTGAIILSIGLAPVGSSIYAYLEERMTVTSTIAAILSFSSTILSTSGPYIVGNTISTDPFVFILYILICNVSVIIMYIMLVIAEVWRRRYLEKQKNLNTIFNNRPNYISKP